MQKPNTQQFRSLFKDDAVWGEQKVIHFRWFLIIVILFFVSYIYLEGYEERALISLLLSSVYIFYNAALNFLLKRFGSATWIRFLSATFDISILSLHIFNYSYYFQPIAVTTAASVFLYPVLILLAVLRYDGRLVIFSTLYSIFCFNLIYFLRSPHISPELLEQVASADWAGQMYKSTYLLLMGYFLLGVPEMIKRLVSKQLVSIEQQNSVKIDLALEKQKNEMTLFQLRKEKILNKKLEEHKQTIEEQKKSLEEAIEIKNKLFSIIGHDLKSPFAAQTSIVDLLLADFKSYNNEDIISILKSIKRSSHQGLELLENILDWSRQQNNMIKARTHAIYIMDVVNNALGHLHNNINHKRIRIHTFINPNAQIIADEDILNTILRNLISNAVKFSYVDGSIKISTREKNDMIYIEISDEGIGMSPEHVSMIFDPGQKISTRGTQNEPGTGLGLFLCKDLASMMAANIDVESEQGKGSTFSIAFPSIKNPVEKKLLNSNLS
nr:HAMP domain-containing sensor histidine kinase [uncultured Carboxylicivirga sp.]